ncbi:MAG TPA: hypothetical protein VFU45_02830 [Gemmatimonadales bacterium]|nr:hypothetical protein [Gemmatimonadales bacterium]
MSLLILLALLVPGAARQQPFLQYGGMFPGVAWKAVTPYIAAKAPRRAACRATTEDAPATVIRTHTCLVRRLLLTNDVRANVAFTVDDSSGKVASIIIAYRPSRDAGREAALDTLTRQFGPPVAADTARGAAKWTQGSKSLDLTTRPLPGTTENGVTAPIVVILADADLRVAIDARVKGAGPVKR